MPFNCEKIIITKTGTPFSAAMTTNAFHKSDTTAVYLHDGSQSGNTAVIMPHSSKTSGRNYRKSFKEITYPKSEH